MPDTTTPYFFIHIMKTAGTTLQAHATSNFPGALFPDPRVDDMYTAYMSIPYLLDLPDERRTRIDFYRGHYPAVVTELIGIDLVTLTLVRDPVERTISFLKQNKRMSEPHRDLSLEEIYEDDWFFPTQIHNHQAKMFAMSPDDDLNSFFDVIDIDDRRLARAKANLAKIDLVGLSHEFDTFLGALHDRYGWHISPVDRARESTEPWTVDAAFRRRIAADNAADMEFYEYARDLVSRQ